MTNARAHFDNTVPFVADIMIRYLAEIVLWLLGKADVFGHLGDNIR